MKQKTIYVEIHKRERRRETREERRLRRLENGVNVALGLGSVAAALYCGWLMGSGAFW